MTSPKISVIIPMYNAEKYIDECLDSLLVQTFQDFEIIIVDDCSTDSSPAIVKRYIPKFSRRLTCISLKENSGNFGYTARNKGFEIAGGEYVFFMDADDMINNTALEELYTAAKKFDADVVYTGRRYLYTSDTGAELRIDKEGRKCLDKGVVEEPTIIISKPHKLLKNLLIKGGVFWTTWTKFVRRKFLLENKITFYEIISGGDFIWTIEIFCCAKRFLRLPKAFYFWRNDSTTSVTREQRLPAVQISTWDKVFVHFARAFADLSDKRQLLKENPAYCYFALKRHLKFCLKSTLEARSQFKPEEVYAVLNRELDDKEGFDMLIKFFFSYVDHQQKEIARLKVKE